MSFYCLSCRFPLSLEVPGMNSWEPWTRVTCPICGESFNVLDLEPIPEPASYLCHDRDGVEEPPLLRSSELEPVGRFRPGESEDPASDVESDRGPASPAETMTIRSRGREPDGVLERGSGEIGFGGSSHVRGMGFGPLVALWALGLVGLALALNELRDVELNASFPSKFGLKYDMISLRNDLAILRDRLSLRHGVTMRVAPDGPAGRVYRFSVHRLALANCLEVRSLELRYQPSEAGLELRAVCRDRKRSAPRLHVGWSASAAVVQAVNRAEKIVVNLQ